MIGLIVIIAFIQVFLYTTLEKYKYSKILTLFGVLLCHLFVFPPFFFPPIEELGGCGMPIMGIRFGFLFFGGGITLIVHFIAWISK